MFVKEVVSRTRNRGLVIILGIFLIAKQSSGLTRCGWMYRDGLRTPHVSQFTALFLTDVPVVNGNKAWCISVKNLNLTVDLGSITNVTKLAVQGENGTTNYVTAYEVDHSEDGVAFTNIKNGLRPNCSAKEFFGAFPGLSTGSDIAESNITIPFRARYVRFRPQESVGDLCTRVDIYGCQSDGCTEWSPWSLCVPTPSACARSRERTSEERTDGCVGLTDQTEVCPSNQCLRECGELGIVDENRSVKDSAFVASSSKQGFEPYRARLNGPSAWCALVNDENQYLEIDLGGETEIHEIRTQGLQVENKSAWVERFFLDFRRTGNTDWKDYVENNSVRIYPGNNNGTGIRSYTLGDEPIARFIRFYPLQWNNEICMRVSVSGCRVPPTLSPAIGAREEEVDEAFWIILWVLLGLLLLLLLLGLLYLCCRYCPCCACCGCFPCAKRKKRTKMTDETMMTDLTSDEIDAGRIRHSTGITETDTGFRPSETETQTLAVHLGDENGRRADTGAVFFSRSDGNVAGATTSGTTISGARNNEGFKYGDRYEQTHVSSGVATSRREEMQSGAAVSGLSQVDGARGAGAGTSREKMTTQAERMRSSQYEREATRSYQDSLRATSSGAQYIGRYDVETVYPGEGVRGRHPAGPPPTIELEVSPRYEDGSWKVERIEKVDDRLRVGAVARQSELEYNGVGYRSVEEVGQSRGLEYRGLESQGLDSRGLECRGAGYRGVDEGDTTITVRLGDTFPARLETRELESGDVSRAARERYFNDDTYRGRRGGVETWKVDCIRGQAFESNVSVDTARGRVTGQPYAYKAPSSPTTSTTSSQFNGSTISEQFGDASSKKGKYYKMFEYSRD